MMASTVKNGIDRLRNGRKSAPTTHVLSFLGDFSDITIDFKNQLLETVQRISREIPVLLLEENKIP